MKFVKKFNETGICEVDVKKLVKAWTPKFVIAKYSEKYTLIKYGRGQSRSLKVEISKEQATEIIDAAKLFPIQDSFFKNAISYRNENNILSEINRLKEIEKTKLTELRIITSTIFEYNRALNYKK
jgi:hypothetical protein